MGFQKLEERQKSGPSSLPASVSVVGKERPRLIVSLLSEFCSQLSPDVWDKCDAFVGDGDDAGKIMLQGSPTGVFDVRRLRGSGKIIDIGFVGSIENISNGKRRTSAVAISPLCVVVDLPDFSVAAAGEDESDDKDADGEDADDKDAAPSDSEPPPTSAKTAGELISGISFDAHGPNVAIVYGGYRAIVTLRHAELLRVLARAMPEPVVVSFIEGKLWTSPPSQADSMIRLMAGDINPSIKPCGLIVRKVPGVGYQLTEI